MSVGEWHLLEVVAPWEPIEDDFPRARYMGDGKVEIQGSVEGGEDGSVALRLPVELRPTADFDQRVLWQTAGRVLSLRISARVNGDVVAWLDEDLGPDVVYGDFRSFYGVVEP